MKNDSTRPIVMNSGTSNKLFNLTKKLYSQRHSSVLLEFHSCVFGSLRSGRDMSNMRNIEEMRGYVLKLKRRNKVTEMTNEDIATYHKLFIKRFGKGKSHES